MFDAFFELKIFAHRNGALEHPTGFVDLAQQCCYIAQIAEGHGTRLITFGSPLLSLRLCCVNISIRCPPSGCLEIRFASVCGRNRLR